MLPENGNLLIYYIFLVRCSRPALTLSKKHLLLLKIHQTYSVHVSLEKYFITNLVTPAYRSERRLCFCSCVSLILFKGRGYKVVINTVIVRKCFIKHMCFIVLYFHGYVFFCWKLSQIALCSFISGKMYFIFGFLFKNIKVGQLYNTCLSQNLVGLLFGQTNVKVLCFNPETHLQRED